MYSRNPIPSAPVAHVTGRHSPSFRFLTSETSLCAGTDAIALPAATIGDACQLASELRSGSNSVEVIAGALPFDKNQQPALWRGRGLRNRGVSVLPSSSAPGFRALREEPAGAEFVDAVERALSLMSVEAPDALKKIVLSRKLRAIAEAPIDPARVLARLCGDPAVTAFQVALPSTQAERWLVGATPELLIGKSGSGITSFPLAGSMPRSADPVADRAAAVHLESSEKDRREHRYVVEFILDTLAPHCETLETPQGTALTSTRSMWHLGTRIAGRLRDPGQSTLELAALLYPTPAVCGVPQVRARDLIETLEPNPRDYYAGCVGWCDARGDGAWHVTIRCAEISGSEALLYAGAGIVPGSRPETELVETQAKFAALLDALGLSDYAFRNGEKV